MKYLISMNASQQHYDAMSGKPSPKPTWSSEDMNEMYTFMDTLNKDLMSFGEWVDGQGLSEPAAARRVQLKSGSPIVTEKPYPDNYEVLAGYWVVDVDSLDRATEIAARVATCPGPGGKPADDFYVDIRPIMDAPPEM